VLYRIKRTLYAIPKYLSKTTSYIQVRLAFHRFSKVIRAYCNKQRFGPLILIDLQPALEKITWFRVYNLILHALLRLVFTMTFITHKIITCKSIIQKVRNFTSCFKFSISAFLSPCNTGFSIFTHVTFSLSV
jgi:hypothetical protein